MNYERLSKENSVLVVVDVQDKLLSAIHEWESVLSNVIKMVTYAKTLNIPVLITEQYSKGLGPTNQQILAAAGQAPVLEKNIFSCFGADEFTAALLASKRKSIVITGIETHICVNQTTLDALKKGYDVHIISDAVGSRSPVNKDIGIQRMRQAGAIISSVEMTLYEWLERSDIPEFKAILPLVK